MKTSALPIRYRVRPEHTGPSAQRGYVWKVVVDPTRKGEDPGYFYDHLFRMIDIRTGRDEKPIWPDGILFENVLDKCQLTYLNGILIDLTNSRVLSKKRPARIRKKKRPFTTNAIADYSPDTQGEVNSKEESGDDR